MSLNFPSTTFNSCPQNPFDILSSQHSELVYLASECGIDWDKASERINSYSSISIKDGIALSAKYKGNTKVWFDIKTTKYGHQYPHIRFHTLKHGGVTTVFNGYDYLFSDKSNKPKISRIRCGSNSANVKKYKQEAIDAEQRQISRFNKFDQEFPFLSTLTESFYFEGKKIDVSKLHPSLVLKRGYDGRGEFIAIPMQNIYGKVTCYQKIYESPFQDKATDKPRNKDYICLPNGKKGTYVVIGSLKGIKKVGMVEGLATGISCFMATNKPVVVSFDAPNMKEVCKHFSGFKIRIFADNDIHAMGGNTGLFTALNISRSQSGVTVVVPHLDGKKCDFNDVLVEKGMKELKKQVKAAQFFKDVSQFDYYCYIMQYAPNQKQFEKAQRKACYHASRRIGTVCDYRKYCQLLRGYAVQRGFDQSLIRGLIKDNFKKHTLDNLIQRHTLTRSRYADNENVTFTFVGDMSCQQIADYIDDENRIIVNVTGMGSGKTEVMHLVLKSFMLNGKKGVYICPRVSLASSGASRLGLDLYSDLDKTATDFSRKLSVCVNSINKHGITDTDLAMMDEIRQLLEFVSTGTVDLREEVQKTLIETINRANTVIMADADFNDFSLDFVLSCTDKKIEVLYDDGIKHDKKIKVLEDAETLFTDASDQLESGKKVWLAVDAKLNVSKSIIAFNLLSKSEKYSLNVEGKRVLTITGSNKHEPAQRAFLLNPNEESKHYDLVISTPVISSGVSVTNDHFDFVYAIFMNVVPANEMLQAIARVRAVNDIRVCFKSGHQQNRQTNIEYLQKGEECKILRCVGEDGYKESTMAEQIATVKSSVNTSLNDFHREFLILAQIKGYKVSRIEGKQEIEGLKEKTSKVEIERFLNAQHIDDATGKRFKKSPPSVQAESDSLDRYLVEEMAGEANHAITEEDVKFYRNKGTTKVNNYELTHANIEDIKHSEQQVYKEKGEIHGLTSRTFFMQYVLNALIGRNFNSNDDAVVNVIAYLQQHHAELTANHLGNFQYVDRAIPKLRTLLSRIGYDLILVKRTNSERLYSISANESVVDYVAKREKKRLNNHSHDLKS